jgi:hypothetical protein
MAGFALRNSKSGERYAAGRYFESGSEELAFLVKQAMAEMMKNRHGREYWELATTSLKTWPVLS